MTAEPRRVLRIDQAGRVAAKRAVELARRGVWLLPEDLYILEARPEPRRKTSRAGGRSNPPAAP